MPSKKLFWQLRGRSAAAQRVLDDFLARYHARLAELEDIALSILIWGPGQDAKSPVAAKRIDIRRALTDCGHAAIFSEELFGSADRVALNTQEYAQALEIDFIVILLEDSPGALGETHEYATDPNIAWKVYLLVSKGYQDGFSALGVIKNLDEGYGAVYWYGPEEIGNCSVLGHVLRRTQARRELYARVSTARSGRSASVSKEE